MTIVGINSHPGGSTKNIMVSILDAAEKELQADTYAFWGNWKNSKKNIKLKKRRSFGFIWENLINGVLSRLTGIHCQGSIIGTFFLIRIIKRIKPDIIHLHNLHLWTINVPMVMRFIKVNNIPVIWTLHDCWSFTGHCAHFVQTGCEKWKEGCYQCESISRYPFSKCDRTRTMWKKKKKWFSDVSNLTLVTPSNWLAELVKQSYLKDYPIKVINNGIDTNIFCPVRSNFRKNKNIEGKFVILGVAFQWSYAKGLDVFVGLANELDQKEYSIVLIGTNEEMDTKLPETIISIHRTENTKEMAEIYSSADIYVNPTREDNFPTTNIEALACGTPVITTDE